MTRFQRSLLVLVSAAAGCEQVKKLDEDPQAGLPCEVQRVLTESCAIEGGTCHTPGVQVPDLSAAGAAESISSPSAQGIPYVDFGNLAGSYMAVKLMEPKPEGAPDRIGAIMPTPPGMITEDDRALLVGWMAGAELEACGGGTGGDDGATTTGTSGADDVAADTSTGAGGAMSCATADVVTDGEKTIDAGMAAGQIPPDIADVLSNNCGCHYGTMTNVYTAYTGLLDMTTLAGFEAASVMPTNMPAVDLVISRLDNTTNPLLHMPPIDYCQTEDGDPMPPADYDLLKSWLEAGVPDGATWESGAGGSSGGAGDSGGGSSSGTGM